ncbi:hypothetical protein, partial [Rhabdaerophilum sp.]|uniref:hypothetical protein n=1 Tax=Rhabdaerophilum sp. TaxID=2717341 RepID=UPI0038D46CE6
GCSAGVGLADIEEIELAADFGVARGRQLVAQEAGAGGHHEDDRAADVGELQAADRLGPVGGACFLGYKLTAARHAEIRRQLDLLDVSETDPGAAAEALTGVDLGPTGRP